MESFHISALTLNPPNDISDAPGLVEDWLKANLDDGHTHLTRMFCNWTEPWDTHDEALPLIVHVHIVYHELPSGKLMRKVNWQINQKQTELAHGTLEHTKVVR